MDNQKAEWDQSYSNRDNFLFYPDEELIVFFSKYIMKRIGFDKYREVIENPKGMKVLDLGCGIGRHVVYCHEMGLEAYGIDLSNVAVKEAQEWATRANIKDPAKRIVQGDIRNLPWENGFFRCVVSHGVLDSMSFSIAREACKDVARVLVPGGLFYCDLISGDDSSHAREFCGEEVMSSKHEEGTIQSYFNFSKINQLIDGMFEILECKLITREEVIQNRCTARYHLVLKRK